MKSGPKIYILTDFSIFSSGIKCILEKAGFQLLGEARQWEDLFQNLQQVIPQVIILNLLPYNDICMEQIKKMRDKYAELPLIVIIKEDYADYFKDFILMGISGFIYQDATPGELIKAVAKVAIGKEYFPEGILNLVKGTLAAMPGASHTLNYLHTLTLRETNVCKLFCKGLTYKEIGAQLYISPRTVEAHKKNILAKLKINTTVEMVKYAMLHHLI